MQTLADVRAVCFDAGNVLCWFGYTRFAQVMERMGHRVPRELFREAELAGRDRIHELLTQARSFGPTPDNMAQVLGYFDGILDRLGVAAQERPAIVDALLEESESLTLWCEAPEEARAVLGELVRRGYSLGVISNTARGDCERVLDSVGLVSYFTQILDSFLVGIEKPDPRIFELAASKLGVTLHQTAFVGDIYEVDVVGARRAGMQPILLDPRGRRQGRDCTVIASLGELLTLLPKKA